MSSRSKNGLTPLGADSRRVFFSADDESFQVFTIVQNGNDGSIYFSAPNFASIRWLVPASTANGPVLLSYQSDGDGKLSLHGSGVTHVRPFDAPAPHQFALRGNMLKSDEKSALGLRHLLTLFPAKPTHRPASPATARKSDYVITAKKGLHPVIVVFWAVPSARPLTVQMTGSFNVDELEEVPPDGGWGVFGLRLHSIVWFAYRTKHMEKWPAHTHACYHDGFLVPLLIGTGEGTFRLELKRPALSLQDGLLDMRL